MLSFIKCFERVLIKIISDLFPDRITIENTNEYQFLIKTSDSIFNRKVCTTDEKKAPSVAWLG
jgi:hypothetical protein